MKLLNSINSFADLFNKKEFWGVVMSIIITLCAYITNAFNILSQLLNNTIAGNIIIILTFFALLFKSSQFLAEGIFFINTKFGVLLNVHKKKNNLNKCGRGGNAKVNGQNSFAIGGNGGDGSICGMGGDGGNAEVMGNNSIARGGSGGNAAQVDGRGGFRTLSPGERNNLPTSMWKYGYGGAGANTSEYDRKLNLLIKIRNEYIQNFPCDEVFINAGIDQVPIRWVNKRLEELKENWRVEMDYGGYLIKP